MRRLFFRILVLTAIVLASSFSGQAIAAKKAMLWELNKDDSTIYLLGSVHVWKENLYPLYDSINKAYERSNTLTVEVNLNVLRQNEVEDLIRKEGFYPAGISILDYLSIEQARALEKKLKKLKLSLSSFQQFKPWLLSAHVTQANLAKLGYLPEHGIDQHFLAKAKAENKPVGQLETLEQQIAIIDSVYADLLKIDPDLLVDETSLDSDYLQLLMETWEMGRYESLYSLLVKETLTKHPQAKPALDKLFDTRNKKFVNQIITMLKNDGTHFVIIGAGHFGGNNGIVALLKNKGYKLRQLDTTSH
ncbi:MAG: hypothetical protein ACI90U_001324 [Pseudomonadales bacterium]|jgi:uncharacterized protein YbaP (TraB family)